MRFKLFTIPFTTMLLAAAGCGASEGTVTGRLALTGLRGVQTDVVATLADGTARRAAVGVDGRFAIEVPRGAPLALAFVRQADAVEAHVAQIVRRDRQAVVRVDDDTDLGDLVELGDDHGSTGAEPGDDHGDDGDEPGDDHGGRGCHTMTPGATPGDTTITTVPSFLVVGSTELPAETPPSTGPLADDDGDGWPSGHDDDRDDDGLCDDHDDDVPDLDEDDDTPDASTDDDDSDDAPDAGTDDDDDATRADLPYHVDPALGSSFALGDAFLEKGAAPARILSVQVEGGWRAAELSSGERFTITEADCSHAGNKGSGRDRIFVAWENADGSQELDHFELRYCDDDR
jgi:hypothetical protein